MEFTTVEYKRCVGNVFTTTDGFKYVQSKITGNYVYLKCALFKSGCKGTSKLNRTINLITPMHLHNHEVSEYKTEVHQLKTKCKTVAKQVQTSSLRNVFDDITRNNPCARDISFAECESAMYRARINFSTKNSSNSYWISRDVRDCASWNTFSIFSHESLTSLEIQ